jgi:hypothetical protein
MSEGNPFDSAAISELKRKAAVAAVTVALAQTVEIKQKVAAAAVATALSLGAPAAMPLPAAPGSLLSPWQSVMRSNQLAKKSRGSLR